MSDSTVRSDGNIDRQARIRSRTARKWLNRLGYKWKEDQKGVFFDGHKREDIVEYRETFLEEIESPLSYFGKFSNDGFMFPKIYPENCTVGGPNRGSIIMITHDESIFSAKNAQQKLWTLGNHGILRPKEKRKDIMISDFLLLES